MADPRSYGSFAVTETKKSRAFLTEEQAVEIYRIKLHESSANLSEGARAAAVAEKFGVSEKAVRDIWSRRTWTRQTKHLDDTSPRLSGKRKDLSIGGIELPFCADSTTQASHYSSGRASQDVNAAEAVLVATDIISPISLLKNDPQPHLSTAITANPVMKDRSSDVHTIPPPLPLEWLRPPSEALDPLPPPSRADDPFHDDWQHWDGAAPGSARAGRPGAC